MNFFKIMKMINVQYPNFLLQVFDQIEMKLLVKYYKLQPKKYESTVSYRNLI